MRLETSEGLLVSVSVGDCVEHPTLNTTRRADMQYECIVTLLFTL